MKSYQMTYGSSIFTSWFQIICGSQRSQLEFVLWWCVTKCSSLAHSLPHLTSDDLDLNEGHLHVKLASAVTLTKFGSHRALFNVFDPRGPWGPRTPHLCKTFVAIPVYMLLTKMVKIRS